jgi:hypothetical protein
MNPSNSHPCTAVRGPRRAFPLQAACGLLAVLLAAQTPAFAQGLIQFDVGMGPFTQYMVSDNVATAQQLTTFPQTTNYYVYATTRSDYPGRLHLYSLQDTLPSGYRYYNHKVWSEATGQSKDLTNIHGPLYGAGGGARWSNDGQDRFVSFALINSSTGQTSLYRAWVSAAEISSPTYRPITLDDLGTPRLEHIADFSAWYYWSHDGSRIYYVDPRATRKTSSTNLIRVKTVGVGVTIDDDPIVFVAQAGLGELRISPPVDPLNPDRYLVATITEGLPSGGGILAIDLLDPNNPRSLATPTGTGLSSIRGPAFSPDGSFIAFGAARSVTTTKPKSTTTYFGVYKVPFFGGPITKVTELTNSSGFVTVNSWSTP